jgi:hypothetical protein
MTGDDQQPRNTCHSQDDTRHTKKLTYITPVVTVATEPVPSGLSMLDA